MWNTRIWLNWSEKLCIAVCIKVFVKLPSHISFLYLLGFIPTHNMQHGLLAKKISLKTKVYALVHDAFSSL